MASEHALGSTPSSSQLLSACDQTSSPSSLAAQSDRRLFTVELACLLCGRALGVLESDAWPTYRPTLLHRASSRTGAACAAPSAAARRYPPK
jgi:hypothetical protein